jgi:hypothetical protein
MARTVIDVMYEDFSGLLALLQQAGEVSLQSIVDSTFKKTLALSAASFFEDEIRRILLETLSDRSGNDELVRNFLKNKAIERQYHTYFQWRGNNANSFFGLFGEAFRDSAVQDVRNDASLADAIKAFLELGDTRNELAHLNFANFALDMTAEEVYRKYQTAYRFVDYLESKLKKFGKEDEQPAGGDGVLDAPGSVS